MNKLNKGLEQPYARDWQGYRRLRNSIPIWVAAFMALPIGVAYVSMRTVGSMVPAFVVAFITMGGSALSIRQYLTWRCPQCGEPFRGYFRRRCRYCGLAKWASSPNHEASGGRPGEPEGPAERRDQTGGTGGQDIR